MINNSIEWKNVYKNFIEHQVCEKVNNMEGRAMPNFYQVPVDSENQIQE